MATHYNPRQPTLLQLNLLVVSGLCCYQPVINSSQARQTTACLAAQGFALGAAGAQSLAC